MTRLVRRLPHMVAIAVVLSAAVASAQPTQADKVRARELYSQGQQLFRAGEFSTAEKSFEEAYAAVPNPVVLLSVAECQVRSERYAEAAATLERYLAERPEAPDKTQVGAQIAMLREKLGVVTVESKPAGALIFVDGRDTGKLTPAQVELPAGDHSITVEISGFQRAQQVISLPLGGRATVSLALPEVAAPEPEPVSPPPSEATLSRKSTHSKFLPVWVAAGVAGAGLVTGSVLGGLALREERDFDDNPTEGSADRGERLALFADVGFGIAAAASVTALVLYLTTDDEKPQEAQGFTMSPNLSTSRVGVSGKLRF